MDHRFWGRRRALRIVIWQSVGKITRCFLFLADLRPCGAPGALGVVPAYLVVQLASQISPGNQFQGLFVSIFMSVRFISISAVPRTQGGRNPAIGYPVPDLLCSRPGPRSKELNSELPVHLVLILSTQPTGLVVWLDVVILFRPFVALSQFVFHLMSTTIGTLEARIISEWSARWPGFGTIDPDFLR